MEYSQLSFIIKKQKKYNQLFEKNYNERYLLYKKQLGIYREKEEEIKSAAFINQYRNKNIAEQAKKFGEDILKASQILSDADIKKGISEIFFHDFLSQYSNYNVYKSLKFGYYYPDLVVIDSQNNL